MDSIVNEVFRENKEKTDKISGDEYNIRPKIMVVGAGGAGSNNVNRLAKLGVGDAKLIAVNTDIMHLRTLDGPGLVRVLIGGKVTKGLGAGGFPETGEKAAIASNRELAEVMNGVNLLFLTAGMGGGTGTGSAPVIAKIAKDMGAIVVAIVTFPFRLERARIEKAKEGIEKLRRVADTVVIIDNKKLVEYAPTLPIDKAFALADDITCRAVRGITKTIMEASLVNLDFADLKAIMGAGDVAMISVGNGSGPNKITDAVNDVLNHPLLDVDIKGGKGALIHITGGPDVSLGDVHTIGTMITDHFAPDANVVWGARVDERLRDSVEVIAILTGVKCPEILGRNAETDELNPYVPGKSNFGIRYL